MNIVSLSIVKSRASFRIVSLVLMLAVNVATAQESAGTTGPGTPAAAAASSSSSAADLPAAIANAPDPTAFPHADGAVLESVIDITIGADKKVVRKHYELTKIFREYMMRARRCDVRVPFDAARQTFACTRCRTWMRSGKAVDTDPATGFVLVTPAAYANAPDYTNRRECVLVHTGVEHGATMEREYTIADREPSGDARWMELPLAGPMPILKQRITIRVPEGAAIVLEGLHAQVAPQKSSANGVDTYVIERTDVPAINLDEIAGYERSVIPRLLYSAVPSWADVGSKLDAAVSKAIDQSPRMRARVDALTKSCATSSDKIHAIHDFVATAVRTVPWRFDAFGFPARRASVIADSAYGHAFDKAILLKAMLKDAGIASAIVLAASDRAFAMRAPTPTQFDEVWLAVDLPDRRVWLEPTRSLAERDAFDLEGHATLKLDARGANVSRVSRTGAAVHRVSVTGTLALDADGTMKGELSSSNGGRRTPYHAVRGAPARLAGMLGRIASRLGAGGTVDERVTVRHFAPSSVRFGAQVRGIRWRVGDRMRLGLPDVPSPFAEAHRPRRDRRTTPLHLPGPVSESVSVAMTLPAGYRLARQHQPESVKNALGSLSISVKQAGRVVTFEKRFTLQADVVAPGDYAAFRALVGPQLARRNREITIVPTAKQ